MSGHRPAKRAWRPSRPLPMTVTIARLVERLTADLGRPPTDQELAATLAISVTRVRHHRRLIQGQPP